MESVNIVFCLSLICVRKSQIEVNKSQNCIFIIKIIIYANTSRHGTWFQVFNSLSVLQMQIYSKVEKSLKVINAIKITKFSSQTRSFELECIFSMLISFS